MKPDGDLIPVIILDFKKGRIRIYKNTMRALGNPEFVLLLVNPTARLIALIKSDRKNSRAHYISHSARVRNDALHCFLT